MQLAAVALLVLTAALANTVRAQDWSVFVSPERDFRVLFPGPSTRLTEADGSVAFKSTFEEVDYVVYRLPPGTPRITDTQGELQRRLQQRLGDEAHIRPVRDDDDDGEWQRHVFEVRRSISIHRLVEYGGRYYELQVRADREQRGVARHTARDFFNSFQRQGISLSAIGGTLVERVESWCQKRTNAFARAFCEYSVCLQPGFEKYPRCTALPLR